MILIWLWLFDMQQFFFKYIIRYKKIPKFTPGFSILMVHHLISNLWRDSPVALARFYSLRLPLALGLVADGDITSCAAAVRLKAIIRPPRPASLSATCVHLAQWRPLQARRPTSKLWSSDKTKSTLFGNIWTLLKVRFDPGRLQLFTKNHQLIRETSY